MKEEFKDRREFLRIPLPNVVQVTIEDRGQDRLTLTELDIGEDKVLKVELDRSSDDPSIRFELSLKDEKIIKNLPLGSGNSLLLRVPLIMEQERDISMPIINMIRLDVGKKDALPAMLVDISAGGARIMSQFPLLRGDELALGIPLPGEDTIEKRGRVVWVRQMQLMREYNFGVEYMVGIKFESPSKVIEDYIHRHMGK